MCFFAHVEVVAVVVAVAVAVSGFFRFLCIAAGLSIEINNRTRSLLPPAR